MPDDPKIPSWIRTIHTKLLLDQLANARCDVLPPSASNEGDTKKVLTLFYEAGLEFQCHVAYFDKYVPVVVVTPATRKESSPPLPEQLRVPLSDQDKVEAQKLRDQFKVEPAGKQPAQAYSENASGLNFQLAKIVADRLNQYSDFVKHGVPTAANVAKSFSLSFVSTTLDFASNYLTEADNPFTITAVNCSAFILSATTTSLSAPLGIGVIGLISTLQSAASCAQNLEHLWGKLKPVMNELSRTRQLVETMPREHKGDNFQKDGNDVKVREGNQVVDHFNTTDVNKDAGKVRDMGDRGDFKYKDYEKTRTCTYTEHPKDTGGGNSNDHDSHGRDCTTTLDRDDGTVKNNRLP